MPIIQGVDPVGKPRSVAVDEDGQIVLSEDASFQEVQLVLLQAILRQLAALRKGMIDAGACEDLSPDELDDELPELLLTS